MSRVAKEHAKAPESESVFHIAERGLMTTTVTVTVAPSTADEAAPLLGIEPEGVPASDQSSDGPPAGYLARWVAETYPEFIQAFVGG